MKTVLCKTLSLTLLVLSMHAAPKPSPSAWAYETATGAGREWAKNTKAADCFDKTFSNKYARLLMNKETGVETTYAAARVLMAEMAKTGKPGRKTAEDAGKKMAKAWLREIAINAANEGIHQVVDTSKLQKKLKSTVGEKVYEVAAMVYKYSVKYGVDYLIEEALEAITK